MFEEFLYRYMHDPLPLSDRSTYTTRWFRGRNKISEVLDTADKATKKSFTESGPALVRSSTLSGSHATGYF